MLEILLAYPPNTYSYLIPFYFFPFSPVYSPKPLHKPSISLSRKESQIQSLALQTLTLPHSASHKMRTNFGKEIKLKIKKPNPDAWRTEQMKHSKLLSPFLIFLFPYILDPNPPQPHHKSKPHTHNQISKIPNPTTTSQVRTSRPQIISEAWNHH